MSASTDYVSDPSNPAASAARARSQLNRVLSELRQQEAETSAAVRRHEEATGEAAEEAAMREREEADALEELQGGALYKFVNPVDPHSA